MSRRILYGTMAVLTGMGTVLGALPMETLAATDYDMRKKMMVSADVIDSFDVSSDTVTRQEFAKMLVRASSYNNSVSAYNDVSVFPDVDRSSEYASYIRVAAEQGWMNAYLGGNFKPEEPVRLHEACRALLALLGYTNDDFSGNQTANRVAKAQAIGLLEDVSGELTQEMTYMDCVNLFYNLMKTNSKANESSTKSSSTIYGALLGFTLTSDQELNAMDRLEANLKGPYVLKASKSLSMVIPFSESSASCYLDGAAASVEDIEDKADSGAAVVIYYNASTKSVYAYSSDGNTDQTMGTVTGNLDAIYYGSSNVMTPTSITVDGETYTISSTDMQYAFSIYGNVEVDDEITIVWQTDSDGNKEVTAYVD